MDPITEFVFNMRNEFLISASRLIDNEFLFVLLVAIALLLGEKRNSKRLKVFLAIAVALASGFAIKNVYAIERPCVGLSLDYCPSSYSFPSLHAIVVFTLMIGFLNKPSFILYFVFALLISFSRLLLGVHAFRDIAAALPVAIIVYYVVDVIWVNYCEKIWKGN
ncbi:MAG: phosphatase PAP2 family protein [Candidatus Bilamarchaeaceae archaeon]